jgi:hypothetical protein
VTEPSETNPPEAGAPEPSAFEVDLGRSARPRRADLARLVVILVVLIGLSLLLMAATHVNSGGCGGG